MHRPASALLLALAAALPAAELPAHLPGELSADEVLNGAYPFPASPAMAVAYRSEGFAADRLGTVPAPGVHPRILMSPDQLPDLRTRLKASPIGRTLRKQLDDRTAVLRKDGTWEKAFNEALMAGEGAKALGIYEANQPDAAKKSGHYQPYPLYALTLDAFAALLDDDQARGQQAGKALAGYARMLSPLVDRALQVPLHDDLWRAKVQGPVTGKWSESQGLRDLMGYHLVGYAYDFAAPFMSEAERAPVRSVIARTTAGRLWMGARLPHHFRNWNWCAVGLGQPLLALAIEGEEGYDARVPTLGAEIARDYLTYGISPSGASTEAVGYTQFGFVWANPFFLAMARRGDNQLTHDHFRNMLSWYAHSMEADGMSWTSHGDGGDAGPSLGTALLWKRFYPQDALADFTLQGVSASLGDKIGKVHQHIIEQMILVGDAGTTDYQAGKALGLPTTWFDPVRSSLIARDAWGPAATTLQFECRTDSVGASHEHADRGAFTFSALGRSWAKDYFRSIESRHHNVVLIDGKGQGFWPGPGTWLGLTDTPQVTIAACDAADAYRWWWPKQIKADVPDPAASPRFAFERWASYLAEAKEFATVYGNGPFERDDRPAVVAHWKGFADVAGGPRMWDEDGWPVRLPFNPVQRAFRTVVFGKGAQPWLLVVDDVQKDGQERLYEWGMMTGGNTEIAKLQHQEDRADLELVDATVARDAEGRPKPGKEDRALAVAVLRRQTPAKASDFQTMPSIRLETYERKDTTATDGRSFGVDKRLIIPTRAVAPDFVVLLQPHRFGTPAPKAAWNEGRTAVTIGEGDAAVTVRLTLGADGRTRVAVGDVAGP
jgi:hypothetical protein